MRTSGCVKHCVVTHDRKLIKQSDAVVFHGRNLDSFDVPAVRHPEQQYVFYLMESPLAMDVDLRHRPWPDFFNLTWTYRTDSDIFGTDYVKYYQPELWSDRAASRAALMRKEDRALAMVSNCGAPSNRDVYVRELQRFFPVDIFGKCGSISCHKANCSHLARKYKFYLSFENAYVSILQRRNY
jgi:hypothetical protein